MQMGGPIHWYDLPKEGRGEGQGKEGLVDELSLQWPTRYNGALWARTSSRYGFFSDLHESPFHLHVRTRMGSRGEQGGAARLFNTTGEQRRQVCVGGVFNCQLVEGYI
jgi:hypothetical protein